MQLQLCLRGRSNTVSIIGICGMGGIGKTTIARALYSRMCDQFEWRTFLPNVREMEAKHGLVRLQEQLLSEVMHEDNLRIWDTHRGMDEIRNRLRNKKAFIILDDVDNLEQLKSVAARSDWFGAGSIVLITTRNEHILSYYESYQLYKVAELDGKESLKLFCLKAFKNQSPREGYEDLSCSFVEYCKGLPLAIDVIGSFLSGRSVDEWDSSLKRLKKIPNKCILDKLQISFDGLEETKQQIFLDITCFFKGRHHDHVKKILESSDLYPDIGIRVLIDKSLISIDTSNRVMMHDLLQDMGREIVKRQSPEEPGKRSRLWSYKEVYHVLSKNTGSENVEGIIIENAYREEKWSKVEALNAEVFLKMKRLRLLELSSLNISCGLVGLPDTLRYLNWYNYPFKSLLDEFYPNQLVELYLRNSNLKQLWKEINTLKKLKIIDLSHSKELILTPDFTGMPNLKVLNFEGCIKLPQIHASIGVLQKLVALYLQDCRSLTTLPNSICDAKSLKILNLNGCSSLETLPEKMGELRSLESLNLGGVGKGKVVLAKPWKFLLPWKKQNTTVPLKLPSSLSNLCSLVELDLHGCHLKLLPFDFGCLPLLKMLDLSGNDFVNLPTSIIRLSKLDSLYLRGCKNLQALPECPSSIYWMQVDGCTSLKTFAYPISENPATHLPLITATNCFQLIEDQKDFLFACLARFLQTSFAKQGWNVQIPKLSMFLPGDDIPGWFTYKTFDDRLVVTLPPNWCSDECIGFAICSIWGTDTEYENWIQCELSFEGGEFSHEFHDFIFEELITDHIWFVFTPLADFEKIVCWWSERRKIEFSCQPRGGMKMMGFRVVYEQDIEELMQYTAPSERWKFDTSKRARNDDFCDDGEESSEGGGSGLSSMELVIPSKRLKTPDDDDE